MCMCFFLFLFNLFSFCFCQTTNGISKEWLLLLISSKDQSSCIPLQNSLSLPLSLSPPYSLSTLSLHSLSLSLSLSTPYSLSLYPLSVYHLFISLPITFNINIPESPEIIKGAFGGFVFHSHTHTLQYAKPVCS